MIDGGERECSRADQLMLWQHQCTADVLSVVLISKILYLPRPK